MVGAPADVELSYEPEVPVGGWVVVGGCVDVVAVPEEVVEVVVDEDETFTIQDESSVDPLDGEAPVSLPTQLLGPPLVPAQAGFALSSRAMVLSSESAPPPPQALSTAAQIAASITCLPPTTTEPCEAYMLEAPSPEREVCHARREKALA